MEQLSNILIEARIIESKSLSKKVSFKNFYIDKIEDCDTIMNTEDLADKSSIKVSLITDKNYDAEKRGKDDEYSIKTSDLFKYMSKTIPDFEKNDYVDFGSEYSLRHLIGSYIADEFELMWYKEINRFMIEVNKDNRI